MELDALATALAVARLGSFAAVARERGVDPSSVSRQVAGLEGELGFPLFERTTRRLSPTEAGRLYLARVADPLEALLAAREAGADVVDMPSGPLRVTASVAFGERWLVPRLPTFRSAYPAIDLDVVLTDAVIDIAAEGIDVGLRLGPRPTGAVVASRLMATGYRAVASPRYLARHRAPAAPLDLSGHDCLVFPLPGYRTRWRFRVRGGAGGAEGVIVRPALTISNALALRRATLEGLGVALLADWTIDDDLVDGALVDLFPTLEASAADFDTAAWVVRPSRAYTPRKVRALIDHLRANVRAPARSVGRCQP